jgi:DnaJ-class molecular chaperone
LVVADEERDMTLDSYVDRRICSRCEGTGRVGTPWANPEPDETVCIECNGTGKRR